MDDNKNNIITPEDTPDDPVFSILEKYGLEESQENVLKKILENKKPNNVIIGELIAKTIKKEISPEELINTLTNSFALTKQKIDELVKEIENTASILQKEVLIPEKPPQEKNTTQDKRGEDFYREPIE